MGGGGSTFERNWHTLHTIFTESLKELVTVVVVNNTGNGGRCYLSYTLFLSTYIHVHVHRLYKKIHAKENGASFVSLDTCTEVSRLVPIHI